MSLSKLALIVVALGGAFFAYSAAYIVNETDQVIITEFGKPRRLVISKRFVAELESQWSHSPADP